MPAITPRPIIKSWGEDTSNKDSPSQTAIGTGIVYSAAISSSQPNGSSYIIYEAVKNLQRTGGLYGSTIPYILGQSCSIVTKIGTRYGIRRFICLSATDITNTPPITGATITTSNGVDIYSGGTIDATNWQDADNLDGYAIAPTVIAFDGTADVPAHGAITVGGRQYVNVSISPVSSVNPETDRNLFMKAPTLDEILALMDGIYYPKWASQISSVVSAPIRRLGVYNFRGQKVEAFGYFMNGNGFTENGTSNQSLFWRSMSSTYPSNCIINNTTMRDYLFSGSAGSTITPKNYIGRVQACAGTPILSSGTADARAAMGGVQDDQVEGHWHGDGTTSSASNITSTAAAGFINATGNQWTNKTTATRDVTTDGTHGTPRIGYNTREATFTVPVPMVVSILPYGQIAL